MDTFAPAIISSTEIQTLTRTSLEEKGYDPDMYAYIMTLTPEEGAHLLQRCRECWMASLIKRIQPEFERQVVNDDIRLFDMLLWSQLPEVILRLARALHLDPTTDIIPVKTNKS